MSILKFDLFSSEFNFNMGEGRYKRGTCLGLSLSVVTVAIVLFYIFYIFNQYFSNLIDPKFRSQSFITSFRKEVPLSQDLIGFQQFYNLSMTLDEYQASQNKTYVVYYPQFYYQDLKNQIYLTIDLDVVKCTDPSLKGFNCIDFSQVSNYTFLLDNSNDNQIYSGIYINMYGCLDLDVQKTTIPDNCASQTEIDNAINNLGSYYYLKLKTQQYNTTSKQIQTNYRSIYNYIYSNQYTIITLNTQIQETKVNLGLLYQNELNFQSPIQYNQISQSFDRQFSLKQGFGPYYQTMIFMDEIVQQFQIQYPTITEILALINGVAALVMIARFIGRFYSQKLIKQDFFMLLLQNIYSDKYEKILEHNNLIEKKEDISQQIINLKQSSDIISEEYQNKSEMLVPTFPAKFRDTPEKNIFPSKNNQNNNSNNYCNDSSPLYKQSNILIEDFDLKDESYMFSKKQNISTQKSFISINKNQIKMTNSQIQTNSKKTLFNQAKSAFNGSIIETRKKNQNNDTLSLAVSQKLKAIQNKPTKQMIQNILFKFQLYRSKDFLKSKGLDLKILMNVGQEVNKNLNIYELYKDIIFLKKAISILLTKDQLAAIQFVGLTENVLNLDFVKNKFSDDYQKIKEKLNYFEKQFCIMQSQQLQEEYIKKFFFKYQLNNNKNEINNRIISSIFKKNQ
ncbi:AMP-binding enzyme family protein (macronuclear) [Tetrahymena thermophila SB210]|uniref:AMP-binding enzyme family protein n=1 Tax=Tetrahymena thermophila (strain SB210) TaxID=312017 RepID=I7M0I9_TETTS|nr:AMP-binding enzyme family protein [Tetrahymena thermophila SB210]EAR87682.3 AMP-binding enzyme family protein [Tetrahymena thermophila SB210]|eukprot:XP_001007927.3 AMP-binding enzyme family protein [Tetrahymena thermophila SB210]